MPKWPSRGAIKEFFKNWRVSYPATLDGHDVYVVQGTAPGIIATFYFDKQTGLLTRMIHYANSASAAFPRSSITRIIAPSPAS